jgi:hypothetical protein
MDFMDADILAAERPIDHKFRQRLKVEINLLGKLALLWIEATHSILSPIEAYIEHWDDTKGPPPDPAIHPSFVELTHLLMFYADTSAFNVDATPLGDFIDAVIALQDTDWFTRAPDTFVDCLTAERRARRTLTRMCSAAFHVERQELPEELKVAATKPRFKPGNCPECGAKLYVTSTPGKTRYLACKKCKYTGKAAM